MDSTARSLLDEYRETKYQQPEQSKRGGKFWIILSVLIIAGAGFVFCANNKLLHADAAMQKISNIRLGDVTVSQLYDRIFSKDAASAQAAPIAENDADDAEQALG